MIPLYALQMVLVSHMTNVCVQLDIMVVIANCLIAMVYQA